MNVSRCQLFILIRSYKTAYSEYWKEIWDKWVTVTSGKITGFVLCNCNVIMCVFSEGQSLSSEHSSANSDACHGQYFYYAIIYTALDDWSELVVHLSDDWWFSLQPLHSVCRSVIWKSWWLLVCEYEWLLLRCMLISATGAMKCFVVCKTRKKCHINAHKAHSSALEDAIWRCFTALHPVINGFRRGLNLN